MHEQRAGANGGHFRLRARHSRGRRRHNLHQLGGVRRRGPGCSDHRDLRRTIHRFSAIARVINAPGFSGFGITGVRNGDHIGINHGLTVGNINGTDILGWSGTDDGTGPTFTFTFDAPITAFAFDHNDRDGSELYKVSLAGQVFANRPFSSFTGSGFFGVVSDTPSVTFSHSVVGVILEPIGIDNVRSNVFTASVPEPASWAMMIAGFGLVGGALRSRRARLQAKLA